MHKAICSSCGAECEVPFKPTGDRPVYCNNCFKKPADGQGKFGGGFQQKSFGDKPAFNKPREENRGNDGMKQQLEQLNIKLDKILNALTPAPKVAVAEKKAEEKKAAIGKTKTAAKKAKKKNKK